MAKLQAASAAAKEHSTITAAFTPQPQVALSTSLLATSRKV
jgi:hypothetical protein